MPPAGFSFFQALEEKAEEGLHLVAFAEGALDALKDAPCLEAKSLVLLSPLLEGSPLLWAKAEALRFAFERGGLEGFARVGRAFFFGPGTVGEEALFEAWREGLREEGVRSFLEFVLHLRMSGAGSGPSRAGFWFWLVPGTLFCFPPFPPGWWTSSRGRGSASFWRGVFSLPGKRQRKPSPSWGVSGRGSVPLSSQRPCPVTVALRTDAPSVPSQRERLG